MEHSAGNRAARIAYWSAWFFGAVTAIGAAILQPYYPPTHFGLGVRGYPVSLIDTVKDEVPESRFVRYRIDRKGMWILKGDRSTCLDAIVVTAQNVYPPTMLKRDDTLRYRHITIKKATTSARPVWEVDLEVHYQH
jgi:hypothetical protein